MFFFTWSGRKNLTRVTGAEIIRFRDDQTSWLSPRLCVRHETQHHVPAPTGKFLLGLEIQALLSKPHCEPFPFRSSNRAVKSEENIWSKLLDTYSPNLGMLKQPLFLQLQTCPMHVTTAWSLSFFQLLLCMSLACTMLQLEINSRIHLVKKHHGCKFAFVAVKNRGFFWSVSLQDVT